MTMKMARIAFRFMAVAWLGLVFGFMPVNLRACEAPAAALLQDHETLEAILRTAPAPLLDKMDSYSIAMEACYDAALGPLELAPLARQAEALSQHILGLRENVQHNVRDNELAYEDLLSSDHWAHIEALRVASAYAHAWAQLSMAVRQVSAQDKRLGLKAAEAALKQLSFEFKHPQLVQRAMYGLATTQIEGGQLNAAKESLARLQSSLRRGGNRDFARAVDGFVARISDPAYIPPPPLFINTTEAQNQLSRPLVAGQGSMRAVELARQALREARPAAEIIELLRPAFASDEASLRAALDLVSRDQLLLAAMDYEPGQSLRVMRLSFAAGQYAQLNDAWVGVKPFYPYLPVALKRRVDYQLGVALLNLNQLERALAHLRAARKAVGDGSQATLIDKLIALAQLSFDTPPDAARLALARRFQNDNLPASAALNTPDANRPPPLEVTLALRARIVLARHEALQKNWQAADKILTGIGPDMPAYRLFLGMRVRLLAEAVKVQNVSQARSKTARGAFALYRLWQDSVCLPGCLVGDDVAVHRAAIQLAIDGDLPPENFGVAYGGFAAANGDTRPLIKPAIGFLVTKRAPLRLAQILEPPDEAEAAFVLGQWKKYLTDYGDLSPIYNWLANALEDVQGRPQAVLLEALMRHDLAYGTPARALPHAEKLAANFPRRPAAWFYRAAVLAANERHMEGARALASLSGRTPADDPVGMGARLGLAALFVDLQRRDQACAMRAKIFSRPQAEGTWQKAVSAFPLLRDWYAATKQACAS